jgi:hypothetical protein
MNGIENIANKQMANITFEDEENIKSYPKKDDCFRNEVDKDVYVSYDTAQNKSFKTFSAMSWGELESMVEEDNHLYEIIRTHEARHSYFDIEGSYQNVNKYYNIEDMSELEDKIIQELKLAIENFKYENDLEEEARLVVMSASNNAKLSLHIIDKTVTLSHKDDCKAYHEAFLHSIRNQPELTLIIDKLVYDSDRNFRLVNQSKYTKFPRPLVMKSQHQPVESFITKVDKSESLKIPKRWLKPKKAFIQPIKEDLDESEISELDILIEKLSDKRFDSYSNWLSTVWCLFACGATNESIHFESSSRCPEKYDYEAVQSAIKQYEHDKSKFNIDVLRAWAKQDSGFEAERVLTKVKKEQPVNKEEHFQFLDLMRKFQGKLFQEMNGMDEFCKEVSSCVSMVLNNNTTFCMYSNDDNQFDLTTKLPQLSFSYTLPNEDKEISTTLQKFMVNNPLKFPLYNNIVFKPSNVDLKRNDLNIWAGFKAQEVDVIDMNIVNTFINHIRQVWASDNDEYYTYIMSWLAQVIKTPEQKTEVAILLNGGQGSGKTLPCDILLQRVFGDNIGMISSGLGSLTQRFNGCTMGKIFANVNELSVVGDDFSASFDKMKSLITDRHLQIEKKGLEHIKIDNYTNFIMTTNHRHTIKIEADDRRYFCIEVSEKYKQNTEYFKTFMETLDNDVAGDHIFTYFKRYPKADMVNLRKIPMTQIKQDMLDNCKSTVERFVLDMNDEIDEGLLYDWIGKEGEKAITCSNFYEQYKTWCINNGEKTWSNKAVGTELKTKQLYKYQDKSQINKIQRKYYVF